MLYGQDSGRQKRPKVVKLLTCAQTLLMQEHPEIIVSQLLLAKALNRWEATKGSRSSLLNFLWKVL